MSDGLAVAKTVWTDADFAAMGWHDNAVHAIALGQGSGVFQECPSLSLIEAMEAEGFGGRARR